LSLMWVALDEIGDRPGQFPNIVVEVAVDNRRNRRTNSPYLPGVVTGKDDNRAERDEYPKGGKDKSQNNPTDECESE